MDGLTTLTPLDEFVRSQIIPSQSISPLERRPPSRPHLLEVSAAQQRQQDVFRDSSSIQDLAKTSSRTQEQKSGSSGKIHYPRTQVPSATAVGYKVSSSPSITAQPISLQGQATNDYLYPRAESSAGGRRTQNSRSMHRDQGGRKSRCGMRDSEDEDNDGMLKPHALSSNLFTDGGSNLTTHPPRIKSAHTSQEVADAVAGIRKLQQSLQQRPHAAVTSATGSYIHQLIKETGNDIQHLTDHIQEEIEHKMQEVRELQHHQITAASSMPHKGDKTVVHWKAAEQKATSQGTVEGSGAGEFQQQPTNSITQTQHATRPRKNLSVHSVQQEDRMETLNILPQHPGESRKREGSAHSSSSRDEYGMSTVEGPGECVQSEKAIPTKISLMICSDHKEGGDNPGKAQFLPLYRSVRAPFFRNYTRRK